MLTVTAQKYEIPNHVIEYLKSTQKYFGLTYSRYRPLYCYHVNYTNRLIVYAVIFFLFVKLMIHNYRCKLIVEIKIMANQNK